MRSIRTKFIGSLIFSLATVTSGFSQPLPPKAPKEAVKEIEQILAASSRTPPNNREEIVRRIEVICESVDTSSPPQDPSSLESLISLTEYQVQAYRLGRKTAKARPSIDRLYAQLAAWPGLTKELLAMSQSRLLLLRQDLALEDQDWKDLDNTVQSLKICSKELATTPKGAKQLSNIAIQSVRYYSIAQRPSEAETTAEYFLGLIPGTASLSKLEQDRLRGKLIDQVLDFASPEISPANRAKWLKRADEIWGLLKDESDDASRSVAGELIAHRASLLEDAKEQQACWDTYHAWLRRDSFVAMQDSRIGPQYIECNIRYLNRLDGTQFPKQLVRVHLFLDELKAASDPILKNRTTLVAPNADLARIMRDQLHRGIAAKMTALKRPAVMKTAPPLNFRRIDNGEVGSIEQFRGKVVVLEFWNPSCGACLAGFQGMSDYYLAHRGKGLVVLGCTYEDSSTEDDRDANGKLHGIDWYRRFLSKREVRYPMVLADNASVLQSYGVTAMPSFVVIDRQGRVLSFSEGIEEFRSDACQRTMKKALSE